MNNVIVRNNFVFFNGEYKKVSLLNALKTLRDLDSESADEVPVMVPYLMDEMELWPTEVDGVFHVIDYCFPIDGKQYLYVTEKDLIDAFGEERVRDAVENEI